jgi:hypothetical protein
MEFMIRSRKEIGWVGPALSLAVISSALLCAGCDEGPGTVPVPPGGAGRPDDAVLGRPGGNPPPVSSKAKKATEALEKQGFQPTSNPRL